MSPEENITIFGTGISVKIVALYTIFGTRIFMNTHTVYLIIPARKNEISVHRPENDYCVILPRCFAGADTLNKSIVAGESE